MIRVWIIMGLALLPATLSGCGPQGVTEQDHQGTPIPALQQAKEMLQNYANGAPIASEAATFPDLIEEVRKDNPQKADILKKGWADLEKSSGPALAKKAKDLLQRL